MKSFEVAGICVHGSVSHTVVRNGKLFVCAKTAHVFETVHNVDSSHRLVYDMATGEAFIWSYENEQAGKLFRVKKNQSVLDDLFFINSERHLFKSCTAPLSLYNTECEFKNGKWAVKTVCEKCGKLLRMTYAAKYLGPKSLCGNSVECAYCDHHTKMRIDLEEVT